jgi:hypothetical protein
LPGLLESMRLSTAFQIVVSSMDHIVNRDPTVEHCP